LLRSFGGLFNAVALLLFILSSIASVIRGFRVAKSQTRDRH
jgi:hypothetical protein